MKKQHSFKREMVRWIEKERGKKRTNKSSRENDAVVKIYYERIYIFMMIVCVIYVETIFSLFVSFVRYMFETMLNNSRLYNNSIITFLGSDLFFCSSDLLVCCFIPKESVQVVLFY